MKRIAKVVTSALTTVIASLVIPLSGATSASAAVQDCPSGAFCLWSDANFSGVMLVPSSVGTGWAYFGTRNFNDLATSGRNNSSAAWCVFDDINYQGALLAYFPPNTQISVLSSDLNDRASSARVC
ncbi:peptidase inhibitor family I36 protein [Streptomyces sp. NPDC048281]|uniref:peptidase inhibitor family I36 protein n=1 Tax=Streptomyces sp. NPDC048281 TaxID=3154715 RepID=UPI0034426D48